MDRAKKYVAVPAKGINSDVPAFSQPEGTYRYALNAVIESLDGNVGTLHNEQSNKVLASFLPSNYSILGQCKVSKNEVFLISINTTQANIRFDLLTSAGKLTTIYSGSNFLSLKTANPLEMKFRLRRGNERVVYFVDGINVPRTLNLDRLNDFKSSGSFVSSKFDLIKKAKTKPQVVLSLTQSGNLLPGTYNIGISLVDATGNSTEVLTTTETIVVYNDSYSDSFETIQGSINSEETYYTYKATNKSIEVSVTSIEGNFEAYRLFLISCNSGNGQITSVTHTEDIPATQRTFTLTGNNTPYKSSEEELFTKALNISTASHIEQIESRLVLGNLKGPQKDLYSLQRHASKIKTNLVTKTIKLNDINSANNQKRGTINQESLGFMPGEIYSFGIVYVDTTTGFESPVYHIVGKSSENPSESLMIPNGEGATFTLTNESSSTTYAQPSISSKDYWGKDCDGNLLVGQKVRHHRFPFRTDTGKDLVTKTLVSTVGTGTYIHNNKLIIDGEFNPLYLAPFIYVNVKYKNYRTGKEDLVKQLVFPNPNYGTANTDYIHIEHSLIDLVDSKTDDVLYVYSSSNGGANEGETFFAKANWDRLEVGTDELPVIVGGNSDDNLFGVHSTYTFTGDIHLEDDSIDGIIDEKILTLKVGTIITGDWIPAGTKIKEIIVNGSDNNKIILDKNIQTSWNGLTFTAIFREELVTEKYDYTTDIYGIQFTDITIPPGFDKYYVVRQERNKDNKTILDSGIVTPIMKGSEYSAFSHFTPSSDTQKETTHFGLYNPEYQFLEEEHSPTNILKVGEYGITRRRITNAYVEDVQPGTSYSPDRFGKRERDTDGFSLHNLVRYSELDYVSTNSTGAIGGTTSTSYLKPLASVTKDINGTDKTLYNASGDNGIGIIEATTPITMTDYLPYILMYKDISNPYSDFRTAPFYKQHANAAATSSATLYSGDSYVSPMTVTTSSFHDIKLRERTANSGVWSIVGGSILATLGIVALFIPGAEMLSPALLQNATVLLKKGVTQYNLKKAYEEDYTKGLKDVTKDGDMVTEFMSNPADDEIQYFFDILENVWFESSINISLRTEPNYGSKQFLASPGGYSPDLIKNYSIDKLTVTDNNNEGGKLYQGFATPEAYDINPDYLRRNRETVYFPLSSTYGDTASKEENFPHRIMWSEQSFQEELNDNYRIFLANNYKDLEGHTGTITSLFRMQNELFTTTETGLWQLPANYQERVTNNIVSFLGTGEIFSIPARKIIDSDQNSVGCIDKFSIIKTPYGVMFVDSNTKGVYSFNGQSLEPLHLKGLDTFFYNKGKVDIRASLVENTDLVYNQSTPFSKYGVGYHSVYDSKTERLLVTKRDFTIDETYFDSIVTSKYDYLLNVTQDVLYCFDGYLALVKNYEDLGYTLTNILGAVLTFTKFDPETETTDIITETAGTLVDTSKIYDTSFTLSYNFKTAAWVSFHSYIPKRYIAFEDFFCSVGHTNSYIYSHNAVGNYQTFYGVLKPHVVEFVSSNDALMNKIYDDISFNTIARRYKTDSEEFSDERYITYNKAVFYNTRQISGELTLLVQDPASQYYLDNRIVKQPLGTVTLVEKEGNWNINELRDYRVDYTRSMFISKPSLIQTGYFQDKIVNPDTVDFEKSWMDLESFRDKFLIIRLIFDTFADVDLALKFSMQDERISIR